MEPFSAPFFGQPGSPSPIDPGPTSTSALSPLCTSNAVNASNILLGIGLIIGSIVSYAPQYYSIWRRKTTEGLNIVTIALGVAATTCIFSNYLYIKWSSKQVCCVEQGFGKCLAHILDGQQIGVTLFCVLSWCAMWLWYFKVDESPEVIRPLDELESRGRLRFFVRLGMVSALGFVVFNALLSGLLNSVWRATRAAQWIGFLLGIAGTACVIVQWAPQIWTTWKLQAVGSLSLLMLLIQLPGTLVVIYFQGFVNSAHWSTVLPYVVTSIEFVVLIALCLFFMARDWWKMRVAASIAAQHPEYSFSHLETTIQSKRTVITNPDEVEAESMMNLEFDGEDGFESDSTSGRFPAADPHSAPPSFEENMKEVQTLLHGLHKKPEQDEPTAIASEEEAVHLDLENEGF